MSLVPVFVSFDYDHDEDLKILLIGQAKNPDSPFWVSDWSVKVANPGWKDDARRRIRRVDQVIAICGRYTNTATGMNEEIRITRDEGKTYFLLYGRSNKTCRKPSAARDSDNMYKWTWSNLKKLIGGSR